MPTTTQTPTGEFPKSSTAHHLDLEAMADTLVARLPGNRRQTQSLARESGVSLLMMAMESGDVLDKHSAAGVVTVQLLRGGVTMSVSGEVFELSPGQAVLIQPGVEHDVRANQQSVILLTVTGGT